MLLAFVIAGAPEAANVSIRPTGSITSRSAADLFADQGANVRTFGAAGDGRADDSAAFMAAIAAAGTNGTVLVPAGAYRVTLSLSGVSSVRFVGSGRGKTVLQRGGSASTLAITKGRWLSFESMTFDGAGGTGPVMRITSDNSPTVVGHSFRDVEFRNADLGVQLADSSVNEVSELRFENVKFTSVKQSVRQAGDNTTNIWWSDTDFSVSLAQPQMQSAYSIKGGGSAKFVNCNWSPLDAGTNAAGIYLDGDAGTNEPGTAVPQAISIVNPLSELGGFFIDSNPSVAGPFASSSSRTVVTMIGGRLYKTSPLPSIRLRGTFPASFLSLATTVATPSSVVWVALDDAGRSQFFTEVDTTLQGGARTHAPGAPGYTVVRAGALGTPHSYFDSDGTLMLRGAPTIRSDASNASISLVGSRSAADQGTDVVVDTMVGRSAGFIAAFRNHGTDQLAVGSAGQLVYRRPGDSTRTPGSATLDTAAGRSAFPAGAASVTIRNALVSPSSIVRVVLQTNDETAQLKSVVPASGSFTVHLTSRTTGITTFGWDVSN
jgi:hypothetical protein